MKIELDFEAAWRALEGHSDQPDLPRAILESYMPALVDCLKRGLSDELVKKAFVSQLTTGLVTFTIVDEKFEAPKGSLSTWNSYNGLRFLDGKLDLYTKKDRFWSNVNYVEQIKLSELLANQPGDALPLAIRLAIRDEGAKRAAVLDKIAKCLGLDQVAWDIEADAAEFIKALPEKTDSFCALLQYIEALAECLVKKCGDELVKEAVVDAFSAKRVQFRVVAAMKKLSSGTKVCDLYNGIWIDKGIITVVTEPARFFCNVYQIENLDIISMF